MRFALVATVAAAAVAIPLAVSATGPQMSSDQFISAVRCTAYEDLAGARSELSGVKWELNAEARRQPAETAAQAQTEVSTIADEARSTGAAALSQEREAACAGSNLTAEADSRQGA
jgi:hypothetical protein